MTKTVSGYVVVNILKIRLESLWTCLKHSHDDLWTNIPYLGSNVDNDDRGGGGVCESYSF